MGDWWNLGDDFKRVQQGLGTLEHAGEAALRVGEYLAQEGIIGLEDLIPDLIRIIQEFGEDPLEVLPQIVDHARRVGLDIGYVLRELIQGVSAYGIEGYTQRLILKVVGPYAQALSQVSQDANALAQILTETVNEVSRRLEPLYGAAVTQGGITPHVRTSGATPTTGTFQGRFAMQTQGALLTTQSNLMTIAATFNGDGSGYTLQDALRDGENEMNSTFWPRLALIAIIDIIVLAGSVVVDAATGGIAIVATPLEVGGIAAIDLIIWFYPLITHLIKWLLLAIGAALTQHAAVSSSSAQDIPWTLPDGTSLDEQFRKLAKRIWYKYKDALAGWLTRIMVAYLACHYSETEIDAFLAIVLRMKEFSEGIINGTSPGVLWNEGDETIEQILAALSPLAPPNQRSQSENLIAAIMMIGPENVRGFGKKFKYQPDKSKPTQTGDIDIIADNPRRFIEVGGASKGWPDSVEPGKRSSSIAQWEKEKAYADSQGATAQLYIQDPGPTASAVDRSSFQWAVATAQGILGVNNVFVLPSPAAC